MGKLPGLFPVLLVFSFLFFLFTSRASAQPTCDRCGQCVGNPEPNDYDACVQCVYSGNTDNSPVQGKYWTVIGCIETTPGGFTQKILRFVTETAGGVVFIVLLYGSFLVLTSAGDPEQLDRGKSLIRSGILALLLIIFSIFILLFIGVTILKLPGFG